MAGWRVVRGIRKLPKFLINKRQQWIGGRGFAGFDLPQNVGDIGHSPIRSHGCEISSGPSIVNAGRGQ